MKRSTTLASLIIAFGLTSVSIAKAGPDAPAVTVRGDGVYQTKPDHARMVAAVVTSAPSLAEAVSHHKKDATTAEALIKSLSGNGVTIERSDFTLGRAAADSREAAHPQPYVARTDFVLRIDKISKLDADVARLISSGLFEIAPAEFEVSNPATALDAARRNAFKSARDAALAYAVAGNFRLGRLEKLSDATQPFQSAYAINPLGARISAGAIALIPPSLLTFRASVIATWRIAPVRKSASP